MAGIVEENPILVLMIGLCPLLAVSSNANDALGMGVAASFVLVASNVLISLLRKVIPASVRIPIFIVIVATFVTLIDLLMHAYQPGLYKNLGVFVPLIVVNCIILGRAEGFAYHNGVLALSPRRPRDGPGVHDRHHDPGRDARDPRQRHDHALQHRVVQPRGGLPPALIFIMPPGGFLAIGFLMALKQRFWKKG